MWWFLSGVKVDKYSPMKPLGWTWGDRPAASRRAHRPRKGQGAPGCPVSSPGKRHSHGTVCRPRQNREPQTTTPSWPVLEGSPNRLHLMTCLTSVVFRASMAVPGTNKGLQGSAGWFRWTPCGFYEILGCLCHLLCSAW